MTARARFIRAQGLYRLIKGTLGNQDGWTNSSSTAVATLELQKKQ